LDEGRWLEEVWKRHNSSETTLSTQVVKAQKIPKGYTSIDGKHYILRPEAIESIFIL
jgi:hypothetical protein